MESEALYKSNLLLLLLFTVVYVTLLQQIETGSLVCQISRVVVTDRPSPTLNRESTNSSMKHWQIIVNIGIALAM